MANSLARNDARTNLVLIGMPGSGKSTLGKYFAKQYGLQFFDTDTEIERRYGHSLQHILQRYGYKQLRRIEEQVLCSLNLENTVISTGGSAIYSAPAMRHLQMSGHTVYLHIGLPTLLRRVNNVTSRGLAKLPQHSLQSLYKERLPLYRHWGECILDNNWPLTAWRLHLLNEGLLNSVPQLKAG